jgi:pimeloyl-ACP methyl ester carboxylesterase
MPRNSFLLLALVFASVVFLGSCGNGSDDDDAATTPDDDTVLDDSADDTALDDDGSHGDDDAEPECDPDLRPVVFVHGFLESGDTWANHAMRFASNGYCLERIYAFNYNSLGATFSEIPKLEAFIDDVLFRTGSTQIELGGHSMGGSLSHDYLTRAGNAAKVAHYAHMASFGYAAPPGGVPTIVISSPDDYIAGESEIPGAENVSLPGLDHLQVATSAESFENVYRFFNDGVEPATTEILPEAVIRLLGFVVTLGENSPVANNEVDVYEVDPDTGERLNDAPDATFTTDGTGRWGPFTASADAYYEFFVPQEGADQHPVHYYREPFIRSDDFIALRTFPPAASFAGLLLNQIPFADDHAVLISFTANRATIAGRDTLTADGYDMATADMAAPEMTTIAIFFFDANGNGSTDAIPAGGLFASFPFLKGFDMFIESDPPRSLPLIFNGRTLNVPNWKSGADGATIAVFN